MWGEGMCPGLLSVTRVEGRARGQSQGEWNTKRPVLCPPPPPPCPAGRCPHRSASLQTPAQRCAEDNRAAPSWALTFAPSPLWMPANKLGIRRGRPPWREEKGSVDPHMSFCAWANSA